MSVIGLLSMLFGVGVVGVEKIQRDIKAEQNKKRSIELNRPTYFDTKGREFLISTGEQVYSCSENGDLVAKSLKTGKVVYNFTYEKKLKEERDNRNNAIKNGKKFYRSPFHRGDIYIEIATGKMYKIDIIKNIAFLYRKKDGHYEMIPGDQERRILKLEKGDF